jgi:CheY-specific phosphatase CheX
VNALTDVPADAQPIDDAFRVRVLAPFVTGVEVALREVARTEAVEQAAYQLPLRRILGDWGVVTQLTSATEGALALGFSASTASALAGRTLADTGMQPDETLIRDCAGELANVVAGQAKAFLAETPDRFTFSPPTFVPAGELASVATMRTCMAVVFATDVGPFVLQLFLK